MKKKFRLTVEMVLDPEKSSEIVSFIKELVNIQEEFDKDMDQESKEKEGLYTFKASYTEEDL